MRRITIDPLTRVEGQGRVEVILDDHGDVEVAVLIVPELRGFESLCIGRPAEEMPRLTSRICGLCPEAHLMASVKALDALYQVGIPETARRLRELFYNTFIVLDHATHFYMLAGPDLFVGPDAPPEERTFFGVIRALGNDVGKRVIDARTRNLGVIERLGGRGVHPVAAVPGGWSRSIDESTRAEIEATARANVAFARDTLELFERVVVARPEMLELMRSEEYAEPTYAMCTVDAGDRLSFYDGRLRVVTPDGLEHASFAARDYARFIGEHVEPWTYVSFPFLREPGWKGLAGGADSGVYLASPLGRLNAAAGLPTPLAQRAAEVMFAALGGSGAGQQRRPIHNRMATHWARLVEMLCAAERMLDLAIDPRVCGDDIRAELGALTGEGVGSVEAPRGTLIHHYWSDPDGILTRVNLIVATNHNSAPMAMSVEKAAKAVIKGGKVDDGLLNMVEMAFRPYDPCHACATHAVGHSPLIANIYGPSGELVQSVRRDG
jgi:F420-non-reducing hydrogenase large subunit